MLFRKMCAAVAIALAALLIPAPAAAATHFTWTGAPCATGAITRHAIVVDRHGGVDLVVAGWTRACGPREPGATVGIMTYRRSLATLWTTPDRPALHPFGRFAEVVALDSRIREDVEDVGLIRAVCVASDYSTPVDCVGIERSRSGRVRAVVPISTQDRRITSVPVWRMPEMGPWPHCGNCV